MKIFLILSIFVFGCVITEKITSFFISPQSFYFENKDNVSFENYLKYFRGFSFKEIEKKLKINEK